MIKLALVQMAIRAGDKGWNLRHSAEMIERAARSGATLALLPEAVSLGWTHPSARSLADAIPGGESFEALRTGARANRLYVCSGLVERAGECVYNSAVLISPQGDLLLHHRKLNELDIAHDLYGLGDSLRVAQTPLGPIGLMICADAFARGQIISRALGMMGAGLILSPSAWAVPAEHDQVREPYGRLWLDNYAPVARDFRLWIAGVSNVGPITAGPWAGRKCIGCSLVVDPEGEPVVQGPYGERAEALLCVDLEIPPRPARGTAWENLWSAPAF
jgi:predicted amidohydrolase